MDFDPEDDFPLPEAKKVNTDDLLYNSNRNYWSQMKEYKLYKNGGVDLEYLDVLADWNE